jgi:hypothetical protein
LLQALSGGVWQNHFAIDPGTAVFIGIVAWVLLQIPSWLCTGTAFVDTVANLEDLLQVLAYHGVGLVAAPLFLVRQLELVFEFYRFGQRPLLDVRLLSGKDGAFFRHLARGLFDKLLVILFTA